MSFTIESKHLNKPWKLAVLLLLIDAIIINAIKMLLRLFRPSFIDIDSILIIRFLVFLLAVFLTGLIYVKTTKKHVDKPTRLKVSLYVAAISMVASLVFTVLLGGFFVAIFGGLLEAIVSAIGAFLAVYLILSLSNKFANKTAKSKARAPPSTYKINMKEKYNIFIRALIFILAVIYIFVGGGVYSYVEDGELSWSSTQHIIVFSFVLGFVYAYVAGFTKHFDKTFNMKLTDVGRFLFLLFLLIIIFVIYAVALPSVP